MADVQTLSFSGTLLRRGFWLYVLEIHTAEGRTWLYVGRTGDSSSPYAQSPINRLGQHLGSNENANALSRHLFQKGIDPITSPRIEMVALGPISPEGRSREDHDPVRNKISAMEKALCDALLSAGYSVLNTVHCRHKPDEEQWREVLDAFATRFPKLKTATTEVKDELQVGGFALE
jgi:hypothetical protein